MIVKEKTSLEVTVDKRHIVPIGERLYTESVELLCELVNNAYDARFRSPRLAFTRQSKLLKDAFLDD